MIALEVGNLDGLVVLLFLIMLAPPIILTIIGFAVRKNNPITAKVLFILAALYLVIGLGICGNIM
ncbi:hypothetical protein [Flavobacterium sp.]|jgi:hypothetical protein|uniref:hypothetical protein n=1 Tax=Flavobacterium sp. TaxID=239 RepID=UPI0037BFC41C